MGKDGINNNNNNNGSGVLRSRYFHTFEQWKPYIAMVSLQFGYAGMNIVTKVSLNRGMSHYVLVVYRHAIATLVMAPFAYVLERKTRPKLTFWVFFQIFALGLLGPVIDQNLYYAGLKLTSPTLACAIDNVLPAMTFVLAVLIRLHGDGGAWGTGTTIFHNRRHRVLWMEKVSIVDIRSQVKIVGTVVCVGGAMVMTLYKGPPIFQPHSHTPNHHQTSAKPISTSREWIEGSLLLVSSCLAWAAFFVLQAAVLKKYSAQLLLTTLICFLGTLQSLAVTLAVEHDPSVWAIRWDMNLLTVVYSGIVASGIAYYVQGVCMRLKGPVFVTAFSPLTMVIVAVMGSFILSESIYLGSIVGGVVIVVGLYAVLWGKVQVKEEDASNQILPSSHKTNVVNVEIDSCRI